MLIEAIAPIPESVPRLASDALNQLRSALEHALFAEVVQLTGRELTQEEAQAIEMPVAKDPKALVDWFKHRRRRTLPVLQESGVLGGRVAALQPHEAADEQSHPLKVLAEYTNHSKHRMPAVAAVRLGTIIPDYVVPGLVIVGEYEDDSPLNVGDVLASVPAGVPVPMSIWPKLGIRRPHTGDWMVLMQELGQLEAWVRTEALPLIILGTTEVDPIPTHLDLTRGYATYGEARAEAKGIPAVERHQLRIKGQGLRDDLRASLSRNCQTSPGKQLKPLSLVCQMMRQSSLLIATCESGKTGENRMPSLICAALFQRRTSRITGPAAARPPAPAPAAASGT